MVEGDHPEVGVDLPGEEGQGQIFILVREEEDPPCPLLLAAEMDPWAKGHVSRQMKAIAGANLHGYNAERSRMAANKITIAHCYAERHGVHLKDLFLNIYYRRNGKMWR